MDFYRSNVRGQSFPVVRSRCMPQPLSGAGNISPSPPHPSTHALRLRTSPTGSPARSPKAGLATCVRRVSQLERITFNPNQCGDRPCIRGMRIRVKDGLDMLASGASEAEVLESYPYLEREDIQAALEYAARQVDHAVVSLAK